MRKVLIIAAHGMVGHIMSHEISKNKNTIVLNTAIDESYADNKDYIYLELNNTNKLKDIILEFQPTHIINCAGVLIKQSNDNPARAIFINSYLPNYLNQLSDTLPFKLIHLSTDCVFSGTSGQYTELDSPDAENIYGRTKSLGEINNNRHLTIRASKIGPELEPNGSGLMNWFFNQSGTIKGFDKAIWSGITTLELTKFIKFLLNNQDFNLNGIVNLTNNQPINKYELLCLFKSVFNIEHITISADSSWVVDKSLTNTNNNLLEAYTVPGYKQMLTELYEFMLEHKNLYTHYNLFN